MKATTFSISLGGLLIFLMAACSSSKMATAPKMFDPSGTWSYTVSNTPMGTITGTLDLTKQGDQWSGKMSSSLGTMPIESIEITDRNILARFTYDGSPMRLEGNFDADAMLKGSIVSDYGSFPISGTRSN
ncbi:MAG: hypothetical protein KDC57_15015 [Saprospiraceae bacterium]|nr:hypothetical protein [Saprospiraceae bacterium]